MMETAVKNPIQHRCYKDFKGERCNRWLATSAEPLKTAFYVKCPKCGNLVKFPE